jgi:hypothetical protein
MKVYHSKNNPGAMAATFELLDAYPGSFTPTNKLDIEPPKMTAIGTRALALKNGAGAPKHQNVSCWLHACQVWLWHG